MKKNSVSVLFFLVVGCLFIVSYTYPQDQALNEEQDWRPAELREMETKFMELSAQVSTLDTRSARCALTSIDFLLRRGEFSAWHRVASDEVWHLLEGVPLRLWLMPPSLDAVHAVTLGEALNPETFVIHVEKANGALIGIYQAINQAFAAAAAAPYPYVNREQDVGVPGLRKAKESYHPCVLVKKWTLNK